MIVTMSRLGRRLPAMFDCIVLSLCYARTFVLCSHSGTNASATADHKQPVHADVSAEALPAKRDE